MPNLPALERLVLLIKAEGKGGSFQVIPQFPDLPLDPFTLVSPLGPKDLELLRVYIEQGHMRREGAEERAVRAESLIRKIGQSYFHQLFANGAPLAFWWQRARQAQQARLVVVSDDAAVHREPWEMLREEETDTPVFDTAHIEIVRKLQNPARTGFSDSGILLIPPDQKIRILMVRARPKTEKALQLPKGSLLDELKRLENVFIDECVPPTLAQLEKRLDEARRQGEAFSIVHFDGHGAHTEEGTGLLIFEDEEKMPDPVGGDRLGAFRFVQVVVLDACRTADTQVAACWDAVAPTLLKRGVQTVIAMPYSTHIDMMRRFFERFYGELSAGKNIGASINHARHALLMNHIRRERMGSSSRESATIRDWWVPQLFQGAEDTSLGPVEHTGHPEYGRKPLTSGDKDSARRRRRWLRSPVLWSIAALLAVLAVFAIPPHYPLLDQRVGERKAANEDCLNSNNSVQCARAIELNKDCCKKREGEWPPCCYQAGYLLESKKPPDFTAAAQYYEEGCPAREPEALACLNLGILTERGVGVLRRDLQKAASLYGIACQAGKLRGCSNEGRTYLRLYEQSEDRDYLAHAKGPLESACKEGQGDARGCTGLGRWYALNKQEDLAFKYYNVACDKNDLIGCARLGDMAPTVERMRDHYQRACDQRDGENGCPGCIELATKVFETSQFGDPGERSASNLYEELCDQGCGSEAEIVPEACRRLAWNYKYGTGGRRRDPAKAAHYFQKGCTAGEGASCLWLGRMVEKAEPDRASSLYAQGCAVGSRAACCRASQRAVQQQDTAKEKHFRALACEINAECCQDFEASH